VDERERSDGGMQLGSDVPAEAPVDASFRRVTGFNRQFQAVFTNGGWRRAFSPDATQAREDATVVVRRERAVAIVLFLVGMFAYLATQHERLGAAARPAPLLLFTFLSGSYLSLGVGEVREWLRTALGARWRRLVFGPAVIWVACVAYAAFSGLTVEDRALILGVYLAVPTLLLATARSEPERGIVPWRELAAATFLGLAIKYHMLPSLPLPTPKGFDVSRLVGLVAGLYLFLIAHPVSGVGFTWSVGGRDFGRALRAFALFAVIAVPFGIGTGFLAWHPRLTWSGTVIQPVVIYLVTGVPEEFLFRGLIQNLLVRWVGLAGFVAASVIFGLSHLPDPRYAVLAAIAGAAYGWVYLRTGKITASGVTHALVDAVWIVFLRA
jgi:membrane protease YdiL (CAAX protease family)